MNDSSTKRSNVRLMHVQPAPKYDEVRNAPRARSLPRGGASPSEKLRWAAVTSSAAKHARPFWVKREMFTRSDSEVCAEMRRINLCARR